MVALLYSALIVFGAIQLLDSDKKTQAITIGIVAVVTLAVCIFILKEKQLRSAFFASTVVLFNSALVVYWQEMSQMFKMIVFGFWAVELVITLVFLYNRFSKRPVRYTGRQPLITEPSSAVVNIQEFCKSKFAEKEKIDECLAKMM